MNAPPKSVETFFPRDAQLGRSPCTTAGAAGLITACGWHIPAGLRGFRCFRAPFLGSHEAALIVVTMRSGFFSRYLARHTRVQQRQSATPNFKFRLIRYLMW